MSVVSDSRMQLLHICNIGNTLDMMNVQVGKILHPLYIMNHLMFRNYPLICSSLIGWDLISTNVPQSEYTANGLGGLFGRVSWLHTRAFTDLANSSAIETLDDITQGISQGLLI